MESFISGGVAGGLIAISLGLIEVIKAKKRSSNGNGHHKWVPEDHATLQRLDRWTVGHDAVTMTIGEESIKQTKVLGEVRDSIKDLCRGLDNQ